MIESLNQENEERRASLRCAILLLPHTCAFWLPPTVATSGQCIHPSVHSRRRCKEWNDFSFMFSSPWWWRCMAYSCLYVHAKKKVALHLGRLNCDVLKCLVIVTGARLLYTVYHCNRSCIILGAVLYGMRIAISIDLVEKNADAFSWLPRKNFRRRKDYHLYFASCLDSPSLVRVFYFILTRSPSLFLAVLLSLFLACGIYIDYSFAPYH